MIFFNGLVSKRTIGSEPFNTAMEVLIEDVGRVDDRGRRAVGFVAGSQGAADFEGTDRVDQSPITGESLPVSKEEGDRVIGGTLNKNGMLRVIAERVGQDTVLARIIKMVREAQGSKAPIANLADRISLYFVPTVMVIATLSGLAWYFVGAVSVAAHFLPAVLGTHRLVELARPLLADTGRLVALKESATGLKTEAEALVALIRRDGSGLVPDGSSVIREDDHLVIIGNHK